MRILRSTILVIRRRRHVAALIIAVGVLLGGASVEAHDVEGGPAAGGGGGNPFNLDCGADGVLIGIVGISGSWIDRIEALCMKIVVTGRWDPPPKRIGRAGGDGGLIKDRFDVRCPEHHAVSGIDGRAGSYVDRIRILCKRIAPGGRSLTGDAIPQTPAGGDGGHPFYQLNCPADHPGRRLTGRAGSYVDQIQLHCTEPVPLLFGAPTLLSPRNGTEVPPQPVLLRWTAQEGAASYRLCLEESEKSTGCKGTSRIPVKGTQTTVDLTARTRRHWLWSVQGCNALDQCGAETLFSSFTVAPTPPR